MFSDSLVLSFLLFNLINPFAIFKNTLPGDVLKVVFPTVISFLSEISISCFSFKSSFVINSVSKIGVVVL